MISASSSRNIAMYSLTREVIDQLAAMQIGKMKVVSITKGRLMPSTPRRYSSPPIQRPSSTNWKPGRFGSKPASTKSDRTKVAPVTSSAKRRAFSAAASSSPRRKITSIAAPSSGRNVMTERMLISLTSSRPPIEHEPGDEDRYADQHHEGVVEDVSRMRPPGEPVEPGQNPKRDAVDDAIDRAAIAALPEELADRLGAPHEKHVVELVKIPFVQQEPVERLMTLGQLVRGLRPGDVEDIGRQQPAQHGEECRQLDQHGHVMRGLQQGLPRLADQIVDGGAPESLLARTDKAAIPDHPREHRTGRERIERHQHDIR